MGTGFPCRGLGSRGIESCGFDEGSAFGVLLNGGDLAEEFEDLDFEL